MLWHIGIEFAQMLHAGKIASGERKIRKTGKQKMKNAKATRVIMSIGT